MDPVQTVEIPMQELAEILELQLSKGGRAALTVTGSSMAPMLHNRRDRVWLTRLTRDPKKGDVILYRRKNGQYVLHRVIQSEDLMGCVCCGDNDWRTELVHRADILGVVCAFCRGGETCTVQDRGYRLYAWLWTQTFPLRRPLLFVRRLLGRLKRAWRARK